MVVAGLLFPAGLVAAQLSDTTASSSGHGETESTLENTPRASVTHFLDLCRTGNYAGAARYLDIAPADTVRGAELARHLKAVLDRHAWLDLDAISSAPEGDENDGLARGTDEIAQIAGRGGNMQPVRLVRSSSGRWLFSRATVRRIDGWYRLLKFHWLLDRLPARLLRPGPGEVVYWQWLALPVLLVLGWLMGLVFNRVSRAILRRIVRRTRNQWDDAILERMSGPLTLLWALIAIHLMLPWMGFYKPAAVFAHRALRAGYLLTFFWALLRSIDVAQQVVALSPWAASRPGVRSLFPLMARVGKILVVAAGIIAFLSELGYSVSSVIAGLGIGGLALALAAQKTVENLFGAFSIGADQPFREGDFVKIEDFVGTVESIGLRSTRVRTLDRTVISIPNGKLADMRLESLTERDRMRLACDIGLVYETTAAQMREVLEGFERVLRSHPKIWPDALVVRFKEFGASSLNIQIMAWFQTPEFSEFQLIRQEILLQFMDVVEKAGSSFAFPTQTVHLIPEKAAE